MQHVRQVSLTHAFSRTAPEAVLLLNTENLPYLADVRIVFWLDSTFPSDYLQTTEIPDLRVYFDGHDISRNIAAGLISSLSNFSAARAQYTEALRRWMNIFDHEAPIAGLSAQVIAQNHAFATQYSTQNWSSFFSRLATSGFGYRGGLHPLHFTFRDVLIAPLSLRQLLYPGAQDSERPLNKLQDTRLVFSFGPSRLYSTSSPSVDLYRGVLTVCASCVFDDAWELEMRERMIRLAAKMAEMSDQVLELQNKYARFEKRAAEFKAIADGINTSVQEFLLCHDPPAPPAPPASPG